VIKLGPEGNQLWRRTLTNGSVTAVAVDASDNVIVSGTTSEGVGTVTTLKFAPDGTRIWLRRFGSIYLREECNDMKVDASGNIAVSASIAGKDTGDTDVLLLKYGSDGTLQWQQRYDGLIGADDWPRELAIDALGNLIVLMSSHTWDSDVFALVKYSPAGSLLWQRTHVASQSEQATLAIDAQNNILVAATAGYSASADCLLAKYRPSGSLAWSRTYNSPYNFRDAPTSVATDAQGNVYVAAESARTSHVYDGYDFLTLMYTASGTLEWANRYNGPSDLSDTATSIRAANGFVTVTGRSVLPVGTLYYSDFYTIRYKSKP
jgi:hypothetical protein